MTERALRGWLLALAVLGIAWVLARVVGEDGGGAVAGSGAEPLGDVLGAVTAEDVAQVRIVRDGRDPPVALERRGETWVVNGHAADSAQVRRLLEDLESSKVLELAASNPDNHGRMGLDAASADTVTVTRTSGEEHVILVGDSGARSGTVFVRLPGRDDVYLVDTGLWGHVSRDVDGWRNRTMARVDTTRVARLEVVRDGARTVLAREDSVWTTGSGTTITGSGVRDLLLELSSLTASGFVSDRDSLAARPEAGRVLALAAGGDTLVAITVGDGGTQRWARVRGDETLYRISQFRASRLLPAAETLTPDS